MTPEPPRSGELEFMTMFARPKTSELRRQQLFAVLREAIPWLLCSQLFAVFVTLMYWPTAQRNLLLVWLASISLCSLALGALTLRYKAIRSRPHSVVRWRLLFLGGTALLGSHWGALSYRLPSDALEAILFLAAVAALLILTLSFLRHSFSATAVMTATSLLPPLTGLLQSQEPPLTWFPIFLLSATFLVHAWRESRKAHRQLYQSLENSALVTYLDNARQHSEQLNQQLSEEVRQRQAAERELQDAQRELEQKIRARTQELSETNELLNQQIKLRRNISDALVKSQTRLSQAIEASHLALWDWDLSSGEVYQSHFNEAFGPRDTSAQAFSEHMRDRIHPDDYQRTRNEMAAYLRGERQRYLVQYRVRTDEGHWIWVEDAGKAVRTEKSGRICRILGTRRDITQEKLRDEELRMAKSVFDNTPEAVFVLDPEFRFVSVNRAFTQITGYSAEETLGHHILKISNTQRKLDIFQQALGRLEHTGLFQAELLEQRKNGDYFPIWLQVNVIRNSNGEPTHYACLFSDMTERKRADEKLQYLLNYDDLTGLANRMLFRDRLHHALTRARAQQAAYALIYVNIDRFKQINESLGQDAGDDSLKQVAQRLTALLPTADTVARLGSDEFGILLEAQDRADAAVVAEQILECLRAPFMMHKQEVLMTFSLGITMLPASAREPQPAMQQANTAMRQAKYLGGDTFEFYSRALQAISRQRLLLETDLRKALRANALDVCYQPKQRLSNGRIDSVEALIRWRHPTLGWISPSQFVPIAEESGLIAEMGEYVLQVACRQAQQWNLQGLGPVKMAVNLSAHQLRQHSLLPSIRTVLKQSGLAPNQLDLELTESSLMENISRSLNLLGKMRAMGIHVTVDDFGTGYSSLSYLKQFPVDAIKIDQIFIKDLPASAQDAAITKAIILLGQSLNIEVIAEGVETGEQLDFLIREGCDVVQGYYLSHPLSAEEMTQRLLAQENQSASVTSLGRRSNPL